MVGDQGKLRPIEEEGSINTTLDKAIPWAIDTSRACTSRNLHLAQATMVLIDLKTNTVTTLEIQPHASFSTIS
jgi:hypothetical protein